MAPKNMRTNPSASLDVCDMRIAGREGEVSFQKEGADWWEIWTLPGPWKMKRMWIEPSNLSKSTEEEGVWTLSDEKLTPAFEHPVADAELSTEGGGRSRRARRSTGGPSARNSVEPSLAPPPKPAPSKPPPPKKTPSSEASTSRRTSMRRSQSATVVPPVSPVKVKKEIVKKEVVPSNAAAGPSTRRRSTRGEPEPKVESPVEEPEALVASSLVDEPEALVEDEAANALTPPPVDAGPLPQPSPPFEAPSQPPSPPPNPPSPPSPSDLPSSSSLLDLPPRVPSPPSPTADAPSQPSLPPPAPPVEAPPSPAIEAAPVASTELEASAEIPPPPTTVEDLPPPTLDEPIPTADDEAPPTQPNLPPVEARPALPVPATAPEEAIPEPPVAPKGESPSPVASPLLPQVETVVDSSSSILPEPAPSSVEEGVPSSVYSGAQEEVKVEVVEALPEPSPVAKEDPRVAEPSRSSNPFALGPSPSSSSSKVDVGVEPKPSVESVEETAEEEKTPLTEAKVQSNSEKEAELVQDPKPLSIEETNAVAPATNSDLLPVATKPSPIPSSSTTIPTNDQPELQVPTSDPAPSNRDLPTPKAANPFGRLTPSSVPAPATPLAFETAPSLPSTAAPSPPKVHVEDTAAAYPPIKEEAPIGLVEGSSAPAATKNENLEVDAKPLPSSSLAPTDVLKPLPSFKRKGGPSATSSQPKKSKPSPIPSSTEERASEKQEARASPREEPKAEQKRGERGEKAEIEEKSTADSKGKGKEKETRGDEPARKDIVKKPRATHPEPATASQAASQLSVPSRKGKERAVPESEDSDDMEEIKTSPKPTSQGSSKRKDPEPSSSPLTEQEDDSPVKPVRSVTSELTNPPPAKKAKKSFKSNRIESSEEEEESSSQGSSSSEDEKPVFEKKKSSEKLLLNLKNYSKRSLPASSTSTPIVASPAPASSTKPVASSSSTPKLSKAPSASATTASTSSVKASGASQLLPKKSLLKPNDGTSTPKDRSKGGSSGTSTPSSSKPKPKAGPAKGSGWLTSLLPDDVSSQQASSSNLKLSAEAKKNKAMEEDIARRKKAYLAEVDAETAKPLDIEAQANVMQHFEKWQQTTLPRGEWLYPLCDGGGWAAAQRFLEKDARGEIPDGRIPRPRNAVEAEDLDFAWIASMEGNWGDAEKVQAYLNDPKHFPRGPGVNW